MAKSQPNYMDCGWI